PDFKSHFVDWSPVSNADITPTFRKLLGFSSPSIGDLTGRVMKEALVGGPFGIEFRNGIRKSWAVDGRRTVLQYQRASDVTYYDAACLVEGFGFFGFDD